MNLTYATGEKMIQNTNHGWGIHLLDTGFQRKNMAACYVMEDDGDVAIIETGTKDTLPDILGLLDEHNFSCEQVKYVIVTHDHLDPVSSTQLRAHETVQDLVCSLLLQKN